MKAIFRKILPQKLVVFFKRQLDMLDTYSTKSYSQEGEDMILKRLFEQQEKGFYVDVGAHHPRRYSNTYFFYKEKGWSGINIDAMPGSMVMFKKLRPRDINIETAIAKQMKEMTFFMFQEPAFNSFDESLSRRRHNDGSSKLIKEQKIITKTLAEILSENLPAGQKINFLSIDVEGLDLEVLHSNSWELYRPEFILIECLNFDINNLENNDVHQFLSDKGYIFFAKTVFTVIFKEMSFS